MPKRYSSKEIAKTLESQGFFFTSQKGSHAKYRKHSQTTLTVIVPIGKRQIPIGTFKSILRQSQLTEDDFSLAKNR